MSKIYKKIGPYQLLREIGVGSFARVYLSTSEEHENQQFAIKMISKNQLSVQNLEMIDKEIEILVALNHPNIIKLIDVKKTKNNWYLIFEFCEFGDLEKYMKKHYNGFFPEELAQKIIKQISKGIEEMHSHKIVHRDLKLANILVNKDFIVKLGDFGFAKYVEDNNLLQSYCGTPITMAIEVLKRQKYNEKCDMWSLGVIIYQMLYGVPPFDPKKGGNIQDLIEIIEKNEINFPKEGFNVSAQAIDIIKKTLVINPEQRMSFQEFFNHPWIKGISKEDQEEQNTEVQYKELLKSAYTNQSQQHFSLEKNQLQTQSNKQHDQVKRPIKKKSSDKYENMDPRNFIHSSLEDQPIDISKFDINEYLGMTIKQKVRLNVDKYLKYLDQYQIIIQSLVEQDFKELAFVKSLDLVKRSMIALQKNIVVKYNNNSESKFNLNFPVDYVDKIENFTQKYVNIIKQKPQTIDDLHRGSTEEILQKYLLLGCQQALEKEYDVSNEQAIQLYNSCLECLKLEKKSIELQDLYEIKITNDKEADNIINKINIQKITQNFEVDDQTIAPKAFSNQLLYLFEFEQYNSLNYSFNQGNTKLHNSVVSQKDLNMLEKQLKERIESVENRIKINDQKLKNLNNNKQQQQQEKKEKNSDDQYNEFGFNENYEM